MTTPNNNLFEQILFTYPLLKRIVSDLEPGEFRNLLLSGQVLPMSRNEANKFLISMVCTTCRNSNATRKVFPCIGSFHHPPNLDLEEIESWWSPINDPFRIDCDLDGPQPYRTASCERCMEGLFSVKRIYQRLTTASRSGPPMRLHMCKTHCLENFQPPLALPKDKCKCDYWLNEQSWRCSICFLHAWCMLNLRGKRFIDALRYRQTTTTFATQEPTFNDRTDEPSLEETCCMIDCKERVWEDVEDAAFLVFCSRCSTVYKEKDLRVVRGERTG